MAPTEIEDLRAEVDRLRRENDVLKTVEPEKTTRPAKRWSWRAFASALCIVIASILVPVSIVAAWARVELVDEQQFVETFAPLADDPHVQALVADQVTTAINESLNVDGLTNDLFDGLNQLDLPPRALAALELLREPAAEGVQGLIDSTVTKLVQSDAFADVWQIALQASHKALVAAATGGTANGAVTIDDEGQIGIQLGPIIEEVKQRLVDNGIAFAANIPAVDKTIVVAQSDSLALVGTVYQLAVTIGWWVPLITLGLFLIGILAARRRSTAVLGSGLGLAIGSGALAIGLAIGGSILSLSAPGLGLSSNALTAIYTQVTGAMQDTAVVAMVLGIIVAFIGWFSGRWRGAAATRNSVASVNAGVRGALYARGVDTGGFGSWLYRQRVLVRVILGVLAIVWLMLLRPLSVGDLFLVLIVWLVVWWLLEIAQEHRPAILEPVVDAPIDPADDVASETSTAPEASISPADDGTADDEVIDSEADTAVLVPATTDTVVIESESTDAATDVAAAPAVKKPRTPRAKP